MKTTRTSLRVTHIAHQIQRDGLKIMKWKASEGLKKLFLAELRDAYWAEKTLIENIPIMIENTSSKELIKILRYYHKISEEHISDLEAIFYSIHQNAVAVRFEAMYNLINELNQKIRETENGKAKDIEIISGIRRIEFYKITTYSVLCYFARTILEEASLSLLQTILSEEKTTDIRFSEIAASSIDAVAVTDKAW